VTVDLSGRQARRGFRYQDLCALRYCVAAALDGRWDEVHHDYEDDVVLLGSGVNGRRIRYVQVKHQEDAPRHWTCARLVAHGRSETVAASILGKLFERDDGLAERDFRLAVNEGVDEDLAPMHYRWGQGEPSPELTCSGAVKLLTALRGWTSPTGAQADQYVGDFLVEQHSNEIADMSARVHAELARLLRTHGAGDLLDDEVDEVLDALFLLVYRAASDDEKRPDHPEAIAVAEFRDRAIKEANGRRGRTNAAAISPVETLSGILQEAGQSSLEIRRALELRRDYHRRWMQLRGTRDGDTLDAALEDVQAVLADSTLEFHRATPVDIQELLARLLEGVNARHREERYGDLGVTLELMVGMLYFAIGRGRIER
jgi:hypothetical protein